MNMTPHRAVAMVAIGMVVSLAGCSKHDTRYYSSHPDERQDMLEDCHGDAGRAEAECQSAHTAQNQSQDTRDSSQSNQPNGG